MQIKALVLEEGKEREKERVARAHYISLKIKARKGAPHQIVRISHQRDSTLSSLYDSNKWWGECSCKTCIKKREFECVFTLLYFILSQQSLSISRSGCRPRLVKPRVWLYFLCLLLHDCFILASCYAWFLRQSGGIILSHIKLSNLCFNNQVGSNNTRDMGSNG